MGETDALRTLAADGPEEAERSDAARAGALADLITERLNSDAAGTRIGTLALFNDTVSFGGGLHTGTGGRGGSGGQTAGGGVTVMRLDDEELSDHTEHLVHPGGYHEALESLLSAVWSC